MTASPLPHITLNNGIDIPQIGLGLWQATEAEAEAAVTAALNTGYRLFDTAAIYGNEAGIGAAIKRSKIPRHELTITSKVWNTEQGFESTLDAFEQSRQKLGVDYIDVYLIHWPVPLRGQFIETWRALEALYEDEKIRSIGVSNFMPEHLEQLMNEADIIPAINQVEIHPDFQQRELRQYCTEHDIAIESWSPLGGSGGQLLDHPVLQDIADKYDKTPAQIAIRWHIENGLIVIPKSVRPERIRENIDVFDFELDEEDHKNIAGLDGDNRYGPHPEDMNTG